MRKKYVEALVQPIIAVIAIIILMLISDFFGIVKFEIDHYFSFAIGTFIGNYLIALFIEITKHEDDTTRNN